MDYSYTLFKKIIANSKQHILEEKHKYSLVTPLPMVNLHDIIIRALNTNDCTRDFYDYQIMKSGKEVQNYFIDYCDKLGLDYKNDYDLQDIIFYFQNFSIVQYGDTDQQKRDVMARIRNNFLGDSDKMYALLKDYIQDENIYGHKLDKPTLNCFFEIKDVKYSLINNDTVMPVINNLNQEFKESINLINQSIIHRDVFNICTKYIEGNRSFIIHGSAGCGKSGTLAYIVEHCEKNDIPYLAIKLDKHIPNENSDNFGKELMLPSSIVNCMHSISDKPNSIIILDQLDSIRWTQFNNRNTIEVCRQIIDEVNSYNNNYKNKITLILSCRTFDLENENSIKNLFESNTASKLDFAKLHIDILSLGEIKTIIGDSYYNTYTEKFLYSLGQLSNLYIWNKLDECNKAKQYMSTNQMIEQWYKQLCTRCNLYNINQSDIDILVNNLVKFIDIKNKQSVNELLLESSNMVEDYLISTGLIYKTNNKISFAHQSIYDFFLVRYMFKDYLKGKKLIDIIGDKVKQTPIRRYHFKCYYNVYMKMI